jgi:hypothetical protein
MSNHDEMLWNHVLPIHVVSTRLGHAGPNITPAAYVHALVSQQEAAARHGRLLFR